MYDGRYIVRSLLGKIAISISYENNSRNIYALGLLLRLGGKATPARIKHELKKDKVITYKTFLKAVRELELAGIIKKEYGEYTIVNNYIQSLRFLLQDVPSKLVNIIDDFFKEKISYQATKAQLGSIIEDLSKKYSMFATNFYLEVCWLMDVYLVNSLLGIVELYMQLEDRKEIELYIKSISEEDKLKPEILLRTFIRKDESYA